MQNQFQLQAQAALYGGAGFIQQQVAAFQQQQVPNVRPPLPPLPPGPPPPDTAKNDVANIPTPAASEPPPLPPGPPPGPPPQTQGQSSQSQPSQGPQGQSNQWGQHFQGFRAGPRPPQNQQGGPRQWGPRPPMHQERGPRPPMNQQQRGPRPLMGGNQPWNNQQQQRGPRPLMNARGPRPLMDSRPPRPDFQQQGNNRGQQDNRRQQQNQGRNDKKDDRREGDWTCPQCGNMNFSFRNTCKWCPNVNKPREDSGANPDFQGNNQRFGNNQNQRKSRFEQPNNQDEQRRFGQGFGNQGSQQNNRNNQNANKERAADWICKIDGTNNFAKRTSCFKCRRPRDQCEYSENQPQPAPPPRPQQPPQQPPMKTQDSPNKTDLAQFEQMFSNWEKQFEDWKVANANNPDQNYVRNYITNMNAMKEKLEDRRRNLQLKNQQQAPPSQPAYYTSSASTASSSKPSTSQQQQQQESSISDIVKAALENSQFGLNPDSKVPPKVSSEESMPAEKVPLEITLDDDTEETEPLFSKRSEGIPGLGDGQDPEIQEEPASDPNRPRIDISDPEAEDDEDDVQEVPAKRPKVDEDQVTQENRWAPQDQQGQQPFRSRRPGACWETQPRPQRPNFSQQRPPFMPRSGGMPMQQPRFSRPPMQRPECSSSFSRPPRPDFAPNNSWNTARGAPMTKPKSAWDERNDLFMNPDEDEVNEEDLFERRDSSNTWNPTAKVVDYGHGQQSSSGSRDQEYDQRQSHQEYDRDYHQDHDNRRYYENERRDYYAQDQYRGERGGRSYDRNDQYYDHHSRSSSYDRDFGNQDSRPRNYDQPNFPAKELRPAPKAFIEPKATPEPKKAPQGDVLQVDDLIHPPGRYMRPPKIVIIFRGIPGAGKSFVAKNIKSQESSYGSEAPRILALDDYFECDGEYEYEAELEDSYRASLVKSFKKQIDDGYFSFIMVDCINNLSKHYEEMWSYAKQKGFEVNKKN